MSASPTDSRHLIPVEEEALVGADSLESTIRRCRNCGELLDLAEGTPRVLAS